MTRHPLRLLLQLALCCALLTRDSPVPPDTRAGFVNDFSQLNPIQVRAVIVPRSVTEVVAAVRGHAGPIAIGGGRYSMGGQTATDGAVQIDMRGMNQVLRFSAAEREITVQAGISWRRVIEYIDPYDLSVQIMQSYANFTVGGALSVNAHGRYVGQGPAVLSVKSIRMVLADGTLVDASPTANQELFYGAIGGYGVLGVIVEATLKLDRNTRLAREDLLMDLAGYRQWFDTAVRNDPAVVMHSGLLYPPAYETVRAVSYRSTDAEVTVTERIAPLAGQHLEARALQALIAGAGGKWLRQRVIEPLMFRGPQVVWRNYEASYDAAQLEPGSRRDSTYVLQEYFVPPEELESFVADMARMLQRREANVLNVSIRHARADPGTLLAWAPEEVFALVVYYRQGTSEEARQVVGNWTRELVDAALAHRGRYYLPYQVWASPAQFHAAYPRATHLQRLKQRVDPAGKFRNRLWDAYFPPP